MAGNQEVMAMKRKSDTRGFSLVELIIVIGIMAVLTGVTFGVFGYINAGKTKKASNKLNSKLTYIQTETMTKKGDTYLYLYKTSDGIYTCTINGLNTGNPSGFLSRSELDTYLAAHNVGDKICDSKVTITGKGSTTLVLSETNMLKVGYSKSTGAFTYSNDGSLADDGTLRNKEFLNRLELKGKQTFYIKLIKATGKHYIENS